MTATEPVDPTNAVGRLLPEGWRVRRTHGYEGGTWIVGNADQAFKRVPHGETVDCVIETPLYGLTIQQPYASLIAHGIKTIETRGFQPRVVKPGDDLAIIAGAKRPTPGEDVGDSGWYWEDTAGDPRCLVNWREPWTGSPLPAPLGAVVAVARFVEALPIVDGMPLLEGEPWEVLHNGVFLNRLYWPGYGSVETHRGERYDDQRPLGDYRPGRYGWLLDNIRRLPEPIPCTGFQGLRALPADVDAATRQAVQ